MSRFATSLLMLFAMLLMPFGMAAAPADATQHGPAAIAMQHCPDKAPQPVGKAGFVECTMVCSAALPAGDVKAGDPPRIVCAPAQAAAVRQLHGLHPDTATPPPKRS